jgi:hypothetical protein
MTNVDDGYDSYYAERLWESLPGIYRTEDTDSLTAPGPLREIIDRIGAQVAVVRRSIDRLWADQSIETCDDWVIPYLGDLLGTNLVNHLDAQARRRDVAKTIHYRRRKGTLDVLEELALDATGWTARVTEGFRRLARARHGLDPAVGAAGFAPANAAGVPGLLVTEGLVGLLTGGLAGGFADLRSSHGAALADTAFDESFRTVDVRVGRGALGHFAIPRLLVFLWRLASFPVVGGTPVAVADAPGQYVFDPTGREIPLFLPPAPDLGDESPVMPREWQVPGPLTSSLEAAITDDGTSPPLPPRRPYPDADVPPRYALGGDWRLGSIWPEAGRFAATPPTPAEPLTVSYNYGFSSMIGAGAYDRDLLGDPPGAVGAQTVLTGGDDLAAALAAVGPAGTVTLGKSQAPDSATYTTLPEADASAEPVASLLVRAGPGMRPVVRPANQGTAWVFTGRGEAELVLDGLTVSGCDIILRGSFDTVRLTACTVDPGTASDPGTAGPGPEPLAVTVDGRPLAPCRIFVEAGPQAPPGERGAIRRLLVDHCILGPVRTRFGGAVETLSITDSIIQGLPATAGPDFTDADVFDPSLLAAGLLSAEPLAAGLLAELPESAGRALRAYRSRTLTRQRFGLPRAALNGLNDLVNGPPLYRSDRFARKHLSTALLRDLGQRGRRDPDSVARLNRQLLEESFPVALGVAALAVADAAVELTRVTVLGRLACHRLRASDSIITDFAAVDDAQDGWVRFSAYAEGSVLPRRHGSAVIPPGAPIFTSDSYGQPGYAQLLETADAAIDGGAAGASISAGAETGSEMGAFSADLNPLREQGLLVKYAEYMPLGLMPVIVHVT